MAVEAKWNQPNLYGGYLKNVQKYYDREPIVQASVQIILSVFAVAFFVFFAIRPTLGTITTLLRKIDDQKQVDQKLDNKIRQLIEAQENLDAYGQELTSLLALAVPEKPEVDRLARELEAISIESQAYIVSLNVQQSPLTGEGDVLLVKKGDQDSGRFVTLGFSLGGNTDQVQRFIELLENMERSVLVTTVLIEEAESTFRDDFPLIADVRATIYYLPENTK